jgi:hypothetical protein
MKVSWKAGLWCLVAVGALYAVGCATAPEPVAEPVATAEPAPVPVAEPAPAPVPLPEAEYAKAKEMKETIAHYGLDAYEPDAFARAETGFGDGEAAYGQDNAASKSAFDLAIAGYQTVIDGGFPALADAWREKIETLKTDAAELKAWVAMPDQYDAAMDTSSKALTALEDKDYRTCVDLFKDAERLFNSLVQTVDGKKAKAEESFSSVAETLQQAEKVAAEAERAKESAL